MRQLRSSPSAMLESDVAEEDEEDRGIFEERGHGLGPGPADYAESVEWAHGQQEDLQQFDSDNGTFLFAGLCKHMKKRPSRISQTATTRTT